MADTPPPAAQSELTRMLFAAAEGQPQAAAELLPLVYEELRRLAQARMASQPADHTLSATALVHEAYLRLVGAEKPSGSGGSWNGKRHFFAAAGQAMRCILIDRARRCARDRHGGQLERRPLLDGPPDESRDALELMALDEALKRLEADDPRKARVVELRYFAGLTIEDTADTLQLSPATVKNEWLYARAWLHRELSGIG